ncbi:MAG: S8 family serine peptidase [Thermoleophilaceae bacterium]
MTRRSTLIAALIAAAALAAILVLPAAASAQIGEPGRDFAPGQLIVEFANGRERLVQLPESVPVAAAAEALAGNERVTSAEPNYLAHAAATADGLVPNDPGTAGAPGGWQATQWNFLPCGSACEVLAAGAKPPAPLPFESRGGIDAPKAWAILHGRGRTGAAGVKIAVLDTGVAYRTLRPKYLKSPDFARRQFISGYDFVMGDRFGLDEDGHGTHVAGTIAEQTGNHTDLTGLAYAAKLLPVRVLNAAGEGRALEIARGIRFASRHGAKVINMSFEFGGTVQSCRQVKVVCTAIRAARLRGAVVVAAAGNGSTDLVAFPARIPGVIGVGATTEGACRAEYSDRGYGVDISAPGGKGESGTVCQTQDRQISQVTLMGSQRTFGIPGGYVGTSMSAAHVSGVAAMVLASGVLGADPSPDRLECQLKATARTTNLGEPFDPLAFGAGLLDAGRAVTAPLC